jgi:YfiR/HmsC-like
MGVSGNARRRVATAVAVLLSAFALGQDTQAPPTEYQAKAGYLLNFAKFVTWPADSSSAREETFAICVLGEDPFGEVLDGTVRGEKIGNKAVVARRISSFQDAVICNVLFISRSEAGQARRNVASLKKAGVLTVSDMPGFIEHEGIIQFTLYGNRLQFEVNLDAAEDARLALSSELLKVASVVHTRRGGKK